MTEETSAPSARPVRWHAELMPLGVPSAGGVVLWHPDHEGVPYADLPSDAAVPVDVEAGVPLVWDAPAGDGGAAVVLPPSPLGRVTAAWLEGGVLHVMGIADAPDEALAAAMVGEVIPAPVLDGVAYGVSAEGATDHFSLVSWRVRAVCLSPAAWPATPRWANMRMRWLASGDLDPRPGTPLSC